MSYKATKPALVSVLYLSMFFIVLVFIRAPFYVLLVNDLYCVEWDVKLYYTIPYEEDAKRHSINSIALALKHCDISLFPNLHVLFKVFISMPVTSCTAERSFSKLRLLKTDMRSVMVEDRLNGLALMAIHKEIKLDYEKILNLYCMEYDTRLKLVA